MLFRPEAEPEPRWGFFILAGGLQVMVVALMVSISTWLNARKDELVTPHGRQYVLVPIRVDERIVYTPPPSPGQVSAEEHAKSELEQTLRAPATPRLKRVPPPQHRFSHPSVPRPMRVRPAIRIIQAEQKGPDAPTLVPTAGLEQLSQTSGTSSGRDGLSSLVSAAESMNKVQRVVVASDDPIDPPTITYQPPVNNKQHGLRGEVVLQVKFLANGTIQILKVVQSLGPSPDQEAYRVASGMKFLPATQGSKYVDFIMLLHFTFAA